MCAKLLEKYVADEKIESNDGGRSRAWTELGDHHPDFVYTLWRLSVKARSDVVTYHFYCYLFHCLTFVWLQDNFTSFRLLSSIFQFPSYDLPHTFCLLFTLLFTIHLLLYSISHLYALCSISIFITSPFVHYSLPSLPNLNNLTFHSLWLCESFSTFSILPCLPYYSKPCSIKSSWFVLTSPAYNCYLPLRNTTYLCLSCLSKLRRPISLGKGATYKLKPSPSVSLTPSLSSVLAPRSIPHFSYHSILCSDILPGMLSAAYLCS